MAEIKTIAKAKAMGVFLERLFGEPVSYLYEDKFVTVYYEPDRLKRVQDKIGQLATKAPGDVRLNWVPMVTPYALKKAVPYAIGLLAVGYLVGKAR